MIRRHISLLRTWREKIGSSSAVNARPIECSTIILKLPNKEEYHMDYMKLLQNIRDNAQQAAEAKRRLMAASQSSAETDEWKR